MQDLNLTLNETLKFNPITFGDTTLSKVSAIAFHLDNENSNTGIFFIK